MSESTDTARRPIEAECDQHYQRAAIDVRSGCCGRWPKPCPYHDGYLDGLAAGLDYVAAAHDTPRLRRLGEALEKVTVKVTPNFAAHDTPDALAYRTGWNACLAAVYRNAGVER